MEHLFLAVHFGGLAVVVAAELASLTARVRRTTGRPAPPTHTHPEHRR